MGRQRAELPGAVAVQLHRSTVEDTGIGRPGAQHVVQSHARRRAGQRRPGRDVGLVCLGGAGLYPSVPGTSTLTVNTPLFDRVEIALPADKFIRITAPGASGHHRLQYINGLHIDGRSTDKTYLPESILRGGGELAFSLSSKPNKSWGTAASSAPPSFGAGSLAVTVNVSPAVVAVDAGTTTDVTVNVQRMVDGPDDYVISGKSYSEGISVASVSGKFGDDGSGTSTVTIKVAKSVRDGYYPLVLTTKAGKGERTFMLLVAAGEGGE